MSELVQLLGFASVAAAAWSVNRGLGLLVTGVLLFVVGFAIDNAKPRWPRLPKRLRVRSAWLARRARRRPATDEPTRIREYFEDVA